MKYAKLINGNLKFVKMPFKIGGRDVFTNDTTVYREQGYKPVRETEMPSVEEGFYPVCEWVENEAEITQNWSFVQENSK